MSVSEEMIQAAIRAVGPEHETRIRAEVERLGADRLDHVDLANIMLGHNVERPGMSAAEIMAANDRRDRS